MGGVSWYESTVAFSGAPSLQFGSFYYKIGSLFMFSFVLAAAVAAHITILLTTTSPPSTSPQSK